MESHSHMIECQVYFGIRNGRAPCLWEICTHCIIAYPYVLLIYLGNSYIPILWRKAYWITNCFTLRINWMERVKNVSVIVAPNSMPRRSMKIKNKSNSYLDGTYKLTRFHSADNRMEWKMKDTVRIRIPFFLHTWPLLLLKLFFLSGWKCYFRLLTVMVLGHWLPVAADK